MGVFDWLKKSKKINESDSFPNLVNSLLSLQLAPSHPNVREAFSTIMVNKFARGYVFGFHDAMLQRFGLVDRTNPGKGLDLMEASYKYIFGDQTGHMLFTSSLYSQDEASFNKGRTSGAEDCVNFVERRIPPMGLSRILIFGLEE
ncbi:MAG TPA: hypothetical protein VFQ94_02120 [Gallionella sp.]|nr:hypothetical protein [Gallionella sp.]